VSHACTGYALATVANVLLRRRRARAPDVSPGMLYTLARSEDARGEGARTGATLRGGLAGWRRHGVLDRHAWDHLVNESPDGAPPALDAAQIADALTRAPADYTPVASDDLDAIRTAIADVGVAVASLRTHDGWFDLFATTGHPLLTLLPLFAPAGVPLGASGAAARGVEPADGHLAWPAPDSLHLGLHAAAVVGYDEAGFWIQNSLGRGWGRGGLGHVRTEDWLANVAEVWVVHMGEGPINPGRGTRSAGPCR
jgi:hypothetical protein